MTTPAAPSDNPRAHQAQSQRDESPAERDDRNLSELVQELRVMQMGVQFLFAALLAIPFQARFKELTDFQRDVYAATLVLALLAAVLLMAPASFHRVVFRQGLKRELVDAATLMMRLGFVVLAAAMLSAVTLVLDVVVGRTALFWLVVLGAALVFLGLWYAWPLALRTRARRS